MKKSAREKFKNKINFVKPLYRKGSNERVSKRIVPLDSDTTTKLRGPGVDVKAALNSEPKIINVKRKISQEYRVTLPGACDGDINISVPSYFRDKDKRLSVAYHAVNERINKNVQDYPKGDNRLAGGPRNGAKIIIHKMPDSWLRVYPAPKVAGETTCSVIVRCVVCQLGLTTFLILWTIIGVFTIQSFEGPHESEISIEFERNQNQLVIDLATELRQITPISSKWKNAIEKRIEEERRLTIEAVGHGAKIKPGQFWNLSGTFLFAVYVMTALGFGAPVPHTVWGRTSALIYALLVIPTHIFLMFNASRCVIANVETYLQSHKTKSSNRALLIENQYDIQNIKESQNCSRQPERLKKSNWRQVLCKKLKACLGVFCVGRGLPLIAALYYSFGVITFGVFRDKSPLECIMFPLEFTTTGGLEHVESYVRISYGIYVEGAMWVLAYALATLRRCSTSALKDLTNHYRLFITDTCETYENKTEIT